VMSASARLKPASECTAETSRASRTSRSGWLAIAIGAGLVLSRISWTSYIWLPFYLMFWLWVSAVAVLLLRRNFGAGRAPGA
jgi:hypothetical protein